MVRAWSFLRLIGKLEFTSCVYLISSFSPLRESIFEIYPQSEIPLLTEIAHLDLISSEECSGHILPNILITFLVHDDSVDFRVVDYRTNYSTCFSADIDRITRQQILKVYFCSFQNIDLIF